MAYSTIADPSAHHQTALYTGNGGANTITNDGNSNLRADWIWFKERSSTSSHHVFDSVRGVGSAGKALYPNNNDAQSADTALTSLNTDGFTLANTGGFNENGQTNVAWQWAAGGTAPTQTYRVVVVSDSGNKYRWRNSTNNATFAQSAVTLDLQEGGTYTIDGSDSTMASHPIKLSTTSDGTHGGGSSYNTGVTYLLDGSSVTESAYVSGYASATTRKLRITVAASAPTLYYYCHYHSGMGGQINTNTTFGSTNFDGSVLSVVSANQAAGFSIVRRDGTGSNATVGHGLGGAAELVINKSMDVARDWTIGHKYNYSTVSPDGFNKIGSFNTENALSSGTEYWQNTNPTSTVFSVGTNNATNESGNTMVSYCFRAIKGYSQFGKYIGNGDSARGTFVYTGFRPAYIWWKYEGGSGPWGVRDNKRNGHNQLKQRLDISDNGAENQDHVVEFYCNGFRMMDGGSSVNGNGNGYIYAAFANQPLVSPSGLVANAGVMG